MRYAWRFYVFTLFAVVFVLVAATVSGSLARAETACANLLLSDEATVSSNPTISASEAIISPSDAIISTLKNLYEERVLTVQDLISIRYGRNPLVHNRGMNAGIYADVVSATTVELKRNSLVRARLDRFIQKAVAESRNQSSQGVQTRSIFRPMMMYQIRPGSFWMGDGIKVSGEGIVPRHKVRISKTFRVADVPVTQWQYAQVMGVNPSAHQIGEGAVVVPINGQLISMKPNNPVENISVAAAEIFLDRVNKWSEEDNPLIYHVIANHIRFARIRVLTEAEWEFVVRNRGAWQEAFPKGVSPKNLKNYFWLAPYSNDTTHPVGELVPLLVDGDKPIYDLIGNVAELVQDSYDDNCGLNAGEMKGTVVDPVVKNTVDYRVTRGLDYRHHEAWFSTISHRDHIQINSSGVSCVGLRLAEVPP